MNCVIGWGVTGKATALAFGITKYFSRTSFNITLNEAAKCRFIFICVPTPTTNGSCDTSIVEGYVSQLSEIGCSGVIVVRSTVTPGTCKRLAEKYNVPVISNPEFLTEKTAEYDAKHPDIIVIGSDIPAWGEALKGLYDARFKGVNTYLTDTVTAETIKYGINCFYALKVVYANQLYDVCKRNGANYEKIKEAMYHRKWIGNNHLDVWFNEKRGAGGRCLKKDLEAFSAYSNSELLRLTNQLNQVYLFEKAEDDPLTLY